MLNLGLCCLRAAKEAPRMRTITYKKFNTLDESTRQDTLLDIYNHNIQTTKAHIEFCAKSGIKHYRISSSLFPLASMFGISLADSVSSYATLESKLRGVGATAKNLGVTLSTHPDQYVCLGSPTEDVRKRSINEFNFQAYVMKCIGDNIPMCLHVSNGSQPPWETCDRFMTSYNMLSSYAQGNICLENEDKGCWSPDTLLQHFGQFKLVYDNWHHHINPGKITPEGAVARFKESWSDYGGPTTFHWSEGVTVDSRSHADYFSHTPAIVKETNGVVWECEVKAKELAIQKVLG